MKQLQDLLNKKNNVVHVLNPEDKLLDVLGLMINNNVHHIVIVKKNSKHTEEDNNLKSYGKVVGMISDRDVRQAMNLSVLDRNSSLDEIFSGFLTQMQNKTLSEMMTTSVICKESNTSLKEAIQVMKSADISAIPVVHPSTENLIGIVTKTDLINLLLEFLEAEDKTD
jgi:CBS domain-containing protein